MHEVDSCSNSKKTAYCDRPRCIPRACPQASVAQKPYLWKTDGKLCSLAYANLSSVHVSPRGAHMAARLRKKKLTCPNGKEASSILAKRTLGMNPRASY